MAINVADNFSYKGSKPLDARIKANTVSALVSTPAADLYDGCFAYVTETKKYYSYDSTNTSDPTLGKWREFQQGGGGGSTYTAGDGIDITNDVISTIKSEVGDMDEIIDELPSGGRVMVTGFTPIGTIISVFAESAPQHYLICDGSTYNKSDYPELAEHLLSLTTHSQYEVSGDDTKFKVPDLRGEFLRGTGTNGHANQGNGANVGVHQDATYIPSIMCSDATVGWLKSNLDGNNNSTRDQDKSVTRTPSGIISGQTQTITKYSAGGSTMTTSATETGYYSRPTNTSVLYCIATKNIYTNPMNDYSTNEKVVGTWIDGKPIYQKTIQLSIPTISVSRQWTDLVDLTSLNIDTFIDYQCTIIESDLAKPLPWSDTYFISMAYKVTTKYLRLLSASEIVAQMTYVTIQYTKTTD